MKIIGHYPEGGDVREDPNLQSLLEHSYNLLSEEYQFESPFRDDISPMSAVDSDDFDLNVNGIELKDDFDLSDKLTRFVSKIREEDKGKCVSGCKKDIWIVFGALLPCVLIPFILFSIMWWGGKSYENKDKTITYVKPQQEDSSGVSVNSSTTTYNINSSIINDKGLLNHEGSFHFDLQNLSRKINRNQEDITIDEDRLKVLSYDWLLILYGIILTLVITATIIVVILYLRKREDKKHEDCRLFFEHQNKMINEYASYLYSIKRVRIQQCETLLSLKQQHALQQMDFQQREMDMRQKEQDNAWKHLGDHQNAVREHLSNLHYEANSDKKEDKKEDKNPDKNQNTCQDATIQGQTGNLNINNIIT